jgi:hypothetical protein
MLVTVDWIDKTAVKMPPNSSRSSVEIQTAARLVAGGYALFTFPDKDTDAVLAAVVAGLRSR